METQTPLRIIVGDSRETSKQLPDKSVHAVITSPPYYKLRSYLPKNHPLKEKEIGQEKTPELFIASLVEVFTECYRILRDDGTMWIVIDDTYNSIPCSTGKSFRRDRAEVVPARGKRLDGGRWNDGGNVKVPGMKPKDLIGIPYMLAFALRAAGWYWRSRAVWDKPNAMPESVKDRPAKSHEVILFMAKSENYFYDGTAIKEPWSEEERARRLREFEEGLNTVFKLKNANGIAGIHEQGATGVARSAMARNKLAIDGFRNKRDVWRVTTKPYSEAHFATFPPDLVEPMMLASTSSYGCCSKCSAPWERVIEEGEALLEWQQKCGGDSAGGYNGKATKNFLESRAQDASATKARILAGMVAKKTIGWRPTCNCWDRNYWTDYPQSPNEEKRRRARLRDSWWPRARLRPGKEAWGKTPAVVYDPFGGSGTVGEVALKFGRHAILSDLDERNAKLMDDRTQQPGLALA